MQYCVAPYSLLQDSSHTNRLACRAHSITHDQLLAYKSPIIQSTCWWNLKQIACCQHCSSPNYIKNTMLSGTQNTKKVEQILFSDLPCNFFFWKSIFHFFKREDAESTSYSRKCQAKERSAWTPSTYQWLTKKCQWTVPCSYIHSNAVDHPIIFTLQLHWKLTAIACIRTQNEEETEPAGLFPFLA